MDAAASTAMRSHRVTNGCGARSTPAGFRPRPYNHGVKKILMIASVIGVATVVGTAQDVARSGVDPALYSELRWRHIGPFRGGRTVGAAGVPQQPNVFYMGVNN